jgi:hypothetical protein
MHTLATRMSARERELAPRYYYKRANTTTWFQKIKNALRAFLSFLFTQVILFYSQAILARKPFLHLLNIWIISKLLLKCI